MVDMHEVNLLAGGIITAWMVFIPSWLKSRSAERTAHEEAITAEKQEKAAMATEKAAMAEQSAAIQQHSAALAQQVTQCLDRLRALEIRCVELEAKGVQKDNLIAELHDQIVTLKAVKACQFEAGKCTEITRKDARILELELHISKLLEMEKIQLQTHSEYVQSYELLGETQEIKIKKEA